MKTLVVYTSQTGFTKRYAQWIAERTGADLFELKDVQDENGSFFHTETRQKGVGSPLINIITQYGGLLVAAMGQLFFSLSIAMGIMYTYGTYMRRDDDLISNVNQVELFDTAISFLAGLMIIPAVVAFGGEQAAEKAGVGLIFVTMPQVFANFPAGRLFGCLFFILVLFAAATSAVSMLETNVHTVSQELGVSRRAALLFSMLEILVIGIITVLGYSVLSHVHPLAFIEKYQSMDILDTLDFISNSVMMPVGGIFTTVLVVAVVGLEQFAKHIRTEKPWYREYVFQLCMCVFVIPCLLVVLLNAIGLLK